VQEVHGAGAALKHLTRVPDPSPFLCLLPVPFPPKTNPQKYNTHSIADLSLQEERESRLGDLDGAAARGEASRRGWEEQQQSLLLLRPDFLAGNQASQRKASGFSATQSRGCCSDGGSGGSGGSRSCGRDKSSGREGSSEGHTSSGSRSNGQRKVKRRGRRRSGSGAAAEPTGRGAGKTGGSGGGSAATETKTRRKTARGDGKNSAAGVLEGNTSGGDPESCGITPAPGLILAAWAAGDAEQEIFGGCGSSVGAGDGASISRRKPLRREENTKGGDASEMFQGISEGDDETSVNEGRTDQTGKRQGGRGGGAAVTYSLPYGL